MHSHSLLPNQNYLNKNIFENPTQWTFIEKKNFKEVMAQTLLKLGLDV